MQGRCHASSRCYLSTQSKITKNGRVEILKADESDREEDGKQLNNVSQWGPILGQTLALLIWGYFIASECCGANRCYKGRLSGLRRLICHDNHTGH